MSKRTIEPTGRERRFQDDEIIVSKTDLNGKILYANSVFMRVSGYREEELLGQPHSLIRHPRMPRAVFKLLWDTIQDGREIFAYVLNLARNGDHYWVLAHVTPSYDVAGRLVGFHSNRRTASRQALDVIAPLYDALEATERGYDRKTEGMAASTAQLTQALSDMGKTYDEFVWSLATSRAEGRAA